MSSKRKNGEKPSAPPDLKTVLIRAREKAVQGSCPEPTAGDQEACPNLLAFLEPEVIRKIDWKGQGEAPRVLREPMIMLSWDRMAGRWKWGLSDKALNLSGLAYADTLSSAIADLESALAGDKVAWKEKKIT